MSLLYRIIIILVLIVNQTVAVAQHWARAHFDSLGIKDYYSIFYVGHGLFKAADYSSSRHGYIDYTGKVIIPFKYKWIGYISDGMVQVIKHKKYGYIDINNNILIPFKYKVAYPMRDGLAAVSKRKKYGFIDKYDKLIIPYKFDYAEEFSEGLCAVGVDGKYGYIDKTGNTVIEFKYDHVYPFINHSAIIIFDSLAKEITVDSYGNRYYSNYPKMGLISKNGEILTKHWYSDIRFPPKGDNYIVEMNDGYGIINSQGEELAPCIHSLATNWEYIVLWFNDERKFLIYDNGEIIKDPSDDM